MLKTGPEVQCFIYFCVSFKMKYMKYAMIILFLTGMLPSLMAQKEKKITILPFRPPKERVKRPQLPKKKTSKASVKSPKDVLDKQQMEKVDTVDDYLRRKSQPMMAPSSSSVYAATVPGFITGERSRYQKGETASTRKNIPFTFKPYDKYDQDPRNAPVYPNSYTDGGRGAGIGFDMNRTLALAFSKNARLKARNEKKRLWEKYPKVVPDDSLVNSLNVKPLKMLSVKQQQDSLICVKDSVTLSNDTVAVIRKRVNHHVNE